MCNCDADDPEAFAGEILRYLRAHPQAADTAEGIARWWIKRQRLHESVARVESALNLLVGRALVESRRSPAGTTLYALHPGGGPTAPDTPDAPESTDGGD